MEFPFNRPMWADHSYRASSAVGVCFPGRRKAAIFMSALARFDCRPSTRPASGRACAWQTSGSPLRSGLGFSPIASIISIRVAISVALVEIMVGAVAGNVIGLEITQWVNFLAGFGAIMLDLSGRHRDR